VTDGNWNPHFPRAGLSTIREARIRIVGGDKTGACTNLFPEKCREATKSSRTRLNFSTWSRLGMVRNSWELGPR
jgi:hypothetical protein